MGETINFFLLSLATWSLASLLVKERGPYGVLARFRRSIGIIRSTDADADQLNEWSRKFPEYEPGDFIATNEFAELLSCIWCTSFWLGIFAGLWAYFHGDVSLAMLLPYCFAVRAIVLVLEKLIRG